MLLVLDDVVARELRMFHLHQLTLVVGNLFLGSSSVIPHLYWMFYHKTCHFEPLEFN